MKSLNFLNKYYKRFLELRPEFELKNGQVSKSQKSLKAQSRLIWEDKKLGKYYDAWASAKNIEVSMKRRGK